MLMSVCKYHYNSVEAGAWVERRGIIPR